VRSFDRERTAGYTGRIVPFHWIAVFLVALAATGAAYTGTAVWALYRLEALPSDQPDDDSDDRQGISLLVPTTGNDPAFPACAREILQQRSSRPLEILFCVLDPDDLPAIHAVLRASEEAAKEDEIRPEVRLLIGNGHSSGPNRKVANLLLGISSAKHEILAMVDGDTFPRPGFADRLAAPLRANKAALSTALYRAQDAHGLGGTLEALAIEADFIPGVAVAGRMGPLRFALGAGIAVRREALEAIGGLEQFEDYIGEDYHLGRLISERVGAVAIAPAVLPTSVGHIPLSRHVRHQLRWCRTVRSQRPWGYLGAIFVTNPLVAALGALILEPSGITAGVVLGAWAIRVAAAVASGRILGSPGSTLRALAIPLHDVLRFGVWCAGALGSAVTWHGERFRLGRGGLIVSSTDNAERRHLRADPGAQEGGEFGVVRAVGRVSGMEIDLRQTGVQAGQEPMEEILRHLEGPQHSVTGFRIA